MMTRLENVPLLVLYLWVAVCGVVRGYQSGPPNTVCDSMMPSHGSNPSQTGLTPFRVRLSKNTFTSDGETVTVTLDTSCGIPFKGFMLQARQANSLSTQSIVGSFSEPGLAGTHLLDCSGGKVVTHTNNNEKNDLEFEWTVTGSLTEHVVFVATFVRGFSEFYVKVYSEVLKYTGDNNLPTGTFPTPHECPVVGGVSEDAECGTSKSCFSDCGTDGKCAFIASWKTEGTNVKFELKAGVESSKQRWIGLGFSSDDKMGDDTVIECAVAMETLRSVNRSKNDGKTNSRTGGLDFTEISLADNVLMCSLSVPQTGNQVFDFNTKYTLLFATGQTKSEISTEKTKHSNLPVVSSEQADLTSNTQSLSSQPASNVLVKAHGSLMISAWVFAASFGLVIARYYKKLGGSRRWCGLHIWFQIHRIAMVLTFTLASVAFIIVFADVKGYSQVGKGANDLQFLQAHPILGIISTALVVINPLMALIRPKPDSATRPIFNWFHWAVGTTAWIISMVTIFIGFEIEKSGVPSYTKYVMAAFVAYQLLVELVLEIQGCIQKSDQKTVDGYEMKNMNGTSGVARHSTMKSGTNGAGVFRSVLLVAHFFILLGFLIALLALVNKQMLRSVYNSL